MKIGLFCLAENYGEGIHTSLMQQLELVVYAEELGFDEAWFGEHHFNAFSVIPDPSLFMAYAAAQTKKIRLGTAGFLAPFYDPIRLAESISVLDNITNGRIDTGFAKGIFSLDTKHFLKSSDELKEMMFEYVEAIDKILNQSLSSSHTQYVDFDALDIYPKPLQKKIPVYIATFANEETIRFAATNGYGLMVSQGASLEDCVQMQELYKAIAGYEPEMVLLRVFCVADSKEEAMTIAIPAVDHFIKSMRAVSAQSIQPRWDEANYKKLLAQRYEFFAGENFLNNGIIGDIAECIERIRKLKTAIPNLHLVLKPSSSEFRENCKMLDTFNSKIRPML